ncbi:MAG: CPBP family intramembrane metalloprotease [Lachnospiraceae bacterium]|nr:CPBP family intramembrane metalloprotease [Lachnospiraceae bacterium]
MKNRFSLITVFYSLLGSILLWAVVTNAWGYTNFFHASSDSWLVYIFDFCCRFIWAMPAILLLFKYRQEIPTTLKQLFTNKPQMKPFIISVMIIAIYNVAGMFFNHGEVWINPDFHLGKHLFMFVGVAFAEELVYRGWGLNALSTFVSERTANVISTIFFVMVHLPAYMIQYFLYGTFPVETVMIQCVYVFVLGVLFGYLFRKGNSLWSCMTLHFLSDFLGVMLIG